VIVGFPGETETDLEILCDFLEAARLDAIGVFGYSDEDGTEAASYDEKLDDEEIRERADHVTRLAEELTAQRAEERIGERVEVLIESVGATVEGSVEGSVEGRAAHQGPEVDGTTTLTGAAPSTRIGDIVTGVVTGTDGVDLIAAVEATA
jgi:tRNA A37 methylthiotransferase MiaB